MAQDQTKKTDAPDLIAEFRRMTEHVNFDDPALSERPASVLANTAQHPQDPQTQDHSGPAPPPLPAIPPELPAFPVGDANEPEHSADDDIHDVSAGAGPDIYAPANAPPTRLPPAFLLPGSMPAPDAGHRPALPGNRSAGDAETASADETARKSDRRSAKRRAAMPSRDQIAANDDAPSIGGLIYALNQKPSRKPFTIATFASLGWGCATIGYATYFWVNEIISGSGFAAFLGRPEFLSLLATLLGPIGLMFALAVIAYRAEEMRLRSSAMTEVAVRLAEPDRMAEQSVASLGQAVRRQVSFMNDAVTRALGRAGELEALVHSEVTALERSYTDNERKIRGLIQELASERDALVNTGDRFSGTLRSMGAEVPTLIEKLTAQQIKLAKIIEGANQNLGQLESAMAQQTGDLEHAVENRTVRLQEVLGEYTDALSSSLDSRMEQIGSTIANRTGDLQIVFEEYTKALDTTLDNRATSMGQQLEQNTSRMDSAFNERLRQFDEAILRSTLAIDTSIGEKTFALTSALDHHAKSLGDTLSRQSLELDESLLQGINAVRRTSENITRQSIKALEGLASQSELLQNVSDNLLGQINTITGRFDNQSQQIIRSANALENANYKIDKTLQTRQIELSNTLDRLSGKADELNMAAQGYTRQIEGSLTEAESRTRQLTSDLARTTEERSRSTIADIERMSTAATQTTTRAIEDLRSRFSNVSTEMTQGLSTLTNQVTESASEARRRAAEATHSLAAEQERMRAQTQALPDTTRESADAMRRVLQDHLRAIDELSSLSRREAGSRDVSRPVAAGATPSRTLVTLPNPQPSRGDTTRSINSLTTALSQELQSRARAQPQQSQANSFPPGAGLGADTRDGWSLGDLLKRASADDEHAHRALQAAQAQPHMQPQPIHQAFAHQPTDAAPRGGLDFSVAARALDPATASAIWQRLGTGQRGIMVRSIYTPEGRLLFDETVMRLRNEQHFAETTSQYLLDFERVLQESDRQDPSGAAAQQHLRSDFGRVYLFLAHASGRIS